MTGAPRVSSKALASAANCYRLPPGKRDRSYNCCVGTIDIASLSSEERLRLLEELWESLLETPEAVPLTTAQREELDRRLDELDREGPTGIPWDDVMKRIRSRAL